MIKNKIPLFLSEKQVEFGICTSLEVFFEYEKNQNLSILFNRKYQINTFS